MRVGTRQIADSKAMAPYAVQPPDVAEVDLFTVDMGDSSFAIVSFPVPRATATARTMPAPPTDPPKLSPAEGAVMKLALGGASNSEIARARRTSERTVANQMASLFRKLGVSSRSELAAYAAWFAPDLTLGAMPSPRKRR